MLPATYINNEEQEAQPKTEHSVEYLPEVPNPQQNTSIFLTFAMQFVKLFLAVLNSL